MKQSIWSGVSLTSVNASAFITVDRQRLKQFGSTVYLNDNDTFEFELHNPKHIHVLAKIKINGQLISGGGIVLRPGERVFLERFLDTNNKFVFHTYEVDGTIETLIAISENGNIEIDFYEEFVRTEFPLYNTGAAAYGTVYQSSITNPNPYNTTTTSTAFFSTAHNNFTSTSGIPPITTSSSKMLLLDGNLNSAVNNPKVETGVVDKGEASNQSFKQSNRTFNSWTCNIVSWKILPMSQKVYDTSDIKSYCGNCGAKIKRTSHKFCPHCGTKY